MQKDWTRIRLAALAAAVIATAMATPPMETRAAVQTCKSAYIVRSASAIPQSSALSLARTAWSSAAAAHYGITWQVWAFARNKSQHCTQSGGVWTCNARAQPCH